MALGQITDLSSSSSVEAVFRTAAQSEHSSSSSQPGLRFLKTEELSLWDALVKASPQGTLFSSSWWLSACGGNIPVLGYFEEGELLAGIPLFFVKRLGFSLCLMPKLTRTWGVVIKPLSGKTVTVLSHEMEILRNFAEHLAKERLFYQRFHPSLDNWLPFYWHGFKQSTLYTHFLDGLDDPERIWTEMSHQTRNKIRKAEKRGLKVIRCGIDTVQDTFVKIFTRQGKRSPVSREEFRRLYAVAKENCAGECFAAVDAEGMPHASTFLVWDSKRTYNLSGGPDPDFRSDGAQAFLTWHSIQLSANHSKVFDFCGSMLEQVDSSIRGFGAKRESYNQLLRCAAPIRMCLNLMGKF